MSTSPSIFHYRGVVNRTRDRVRVLGRLDELELRPGEILWLRGSNGIGKSTLLRSLALGEVEAAEVLQPFSVSRGFLLPQLGGLWCHIPLRLKDILGFSHSSELHRNLDGLNLNTNWNHASGGERQRTLLALALSRDPEVLLLDEPFNHIDETVASAVSETLATWLRADRSIVLVSHNCHLMKPLEARAAVREIHLNQPPPEERG